uniref:glutaminase n=1 Tax=Echeneis naucrates TaxID=173247 RepID=A0A665W6H0_ECHNA
MLHFRFSTLLKELFETALKRPLPGSRQRTWLPTGHCCFGAASVDARAASTQLRVLHAAAHRPAPRTEPRAAPVRSYCVKTEGAVVLDEQVKKDGSSREAASDKRRNAGILPSLEDLLFYTVAEGQETIPAHKFLTALKATGLRTGDPRLKDCMETLKETLKKTSDGVTLDRHLFKRCVQSSIVLLTQAFRKKFVIPDFQSFTSHIDELYENAKNLSGGQVADYIPQLAKFSPDLWAVSLCTVDGQRHTVGDTKVPFCLQSCVKPLKYAVAVHDHGTEYVHSFIGKEPSGLRFNKLFLNEDDKPHNPMVNAGAIVCTSLIKVKAVALFFFFFFLIIIFFIFFFLCVQFQSERESGDRNFAIGYYLKEKKVWLWDEPCLCSIEVTSESASVMAATLANGGICPITGERVLSPEAVRNTLSLMHSCGMYDFSGQFAFHVGLPAKSGVAGGILLVVPNVMGIMCWSPPLDKMGNSVRGIQFCTDLVEFFNFHNYDNLRHFAKKHDPRREGGEHNFIALSVCTCSCRFALSSMDMEQRDYESRTALHVAAAEGHTEVVRFLLEVCKVNPVPKDRWGNTPLDEAMHFGHHDVVTLLQHYGASAEASEKNAE